MKRSPLFILLFAGCVTTLDLSTEERSRTYNFNHDYVFDATIRMLSQRGFPISKVTKNEGTIATDFRYQDGNSLAHLSDAPTRVRVFAVIRIAPNGTRVLLALDLQELSEGGNQGYQPILLTQSDAEEYYDDFFETLERYLN